MDCSLIVARLKDQARSLVDVQGAAAYANATAAYKRTPSAFVIPLGETAHKNELVNAVSQEVALNFGVIYAIRNVVDARGDQANTDLAAIRAQGFSALLGWWPSGLNNPCTFVKGRLLELNNLTLWWQDDFATQETIRST